MRAYGYVAKIDKDKCVNCGMCEIKCDFMAIYRDRNNFVHVNFALCRGCEACLQLSEKGAIALELVVTGVLAPLDIKALRTQKP